MDVKIGENTLAFFRATNTSDQPITAPRPSTSPRAGAAFFNKLQCFCFTEQRLEPGAVDGVAGELLRRSRRSCNDKDARGDHAHHAVLHLLSGRAPKAGAAPRQPARATGLRHRRSASGDRAGSDKAATASRARRGQGAASMADTHAKHHDYHLVNPSPWPVVGSIVRLHHGGRR